MDEAYLSGVVLGRQDLDGVVERAIHAHSPRLADDHEPVVLVQDLRGRGHIYAPPAAGGREGPYLELGPLRRLHGGRHAISSARRHTGAGARIGGPLHEAQAWPTPARASGEGEGEEDG